ncbi:MauE/DoxX family redox-associated membrane protein [Ekhidna sp. MALMAid0563]|uniref:DoxX family protein n=1 Tax=Ekhidna sp. MALMAid0563 TaxID=3143937 RepID=UPI0032DE8ED0
MTLLFMTIETISLWIMAILYIIAGINHFIMPRFYEKIIPPFLVNKTLINWLSGIAEIILGVLLLIPSYTSLAAWGIIALLLAVYPANIYHFMKGYRKKKMVWVLALRLPLQFVLIWWAYTLT